MRENGGRSVANTAVAQSKETAKLEIIGDVVELVPDLFGQRSLGGNGAKGKNGGDQSVLDEIRSAFVIQETLQKLLRTVHVRFPPVYVPHGHGTLGERAAFASML
jgi:hypothetical protein